MIDQKKGGKPAAQEEDSPAKRCRDEFGRFKKQDSGPIISDGSSGAFVRNGTPNVHAEHGDTWEAILERDPELTRSLVEGITNVIEGQGLAVGKEDALSLARRLSTYYGIPDPVRVMRIAHDNGLEPTDDEVQKICWAIMAAQKVIQDRTRTKKKE